MPLVASLTKDFANHPHVLKFFNTPDSKAKLFLNFSGDNAKTYIFTYQELAKSHQGKEDQNFLKEKIEAEEMESWLKEYFDRTLKECKSQSPYLKRMMIL